MGTQKFEFPNANEARQIGGWIRTSKRWKKTGERDTLAWEPARRPHTFTSLAKWLTLFILANKKAGNDKD
jgi:hypothetical protein